MASARPPPERSALGARGANLVLLDLGPGAVRAVARGIGDRHALPPAVDVLDRAVTAEMVAARVVDGTARRSPGIVVPRRWEAVSALRGLVGPLTDHRLAAGSRLRDLIRLIRRLER